MAFAALRLQTIASELPKNKYLVDFFIVMQPIFSSDYKHINTDPSRIKYCNQNDVNLIT